MDSDRRKLMVGGAGLAAGVVLAGAAPSAVAADDAENEHAHAGVSKDGDMVSADVENRCATCLFWGGMRKYSADTKMVTTQSLGWCNNSKSPNHGKMTNSSHEMKVADVWTKWPALS